MSMESTDIHKKIINDNEYLTLVELEKMFYMLATRANLLKVMRADELLNESKE